MGAYLLKRILWMVPTLVGISFVTFLLMDLAPGNQAVVAAQSTSGDSAESVIARHERATALMNQLGLTDSVTGEKRPMIDRYLRWLVKAASLQFDGEAGDRFGRKILDALPVTMLINALALLLALSIAIPLGARAGMQSGGLVDRLSNYGAYVIYGMPEFLIATLLLLVFGGAFFAPVLPVVGLNSDDAVSMSTWQRVIDTCLHLILPVSTLALGYGALLFRFLRGSVERAAGSDFALALRGYGMPESVVRQRVLRNGLSPVVTILGTMLPVLVGGTVVVESIFSLPGIGQLTIQAVNQRDMALVMALTMLVSVATLVSFVLSDIVQRMIDPRVELR